MLYVYDRPKSSSEPREMGERGAQHQAIKLLALKMCCKNWFDSAVFEAMLLLVEQTPVRIF